MTNPNSHEIRSRSSSTNQLYLATFYRDNPYWGITAEALILNAIDAEEWYRTKQDDFTDTHPDAKNDEDNDEILDIRENYLSYEHLDTWHEYRFEITPLSEGVYHSLK